MPKNHSIVGSQRAILRRLGSMPKVRFYINGTLVFTYGVVGSGGDYSSIIQALAAQYGVDPSAVTVNVKRGSIIVNFTIYYGTSPPTIPTNASFINTITSAILNNSSTNLTFTGPANAATLTIATTGSTSTTQLTAPNLFNKFNTSGVTLPASPAFSSAFDHIGNYFLVYLHKIYKITPNGVVSLFAGGDEGGFNNGNGTQARFSFSGDVGSEMAFDSENNMYLSDIGNHRIRKITPNGDVSTLAGSEPGNYVDVDGIGEEAVITTPIGLTIDSDNLFVSSAGLNIRKINISTREVSTLDMETPPVYKYVSLRFDSNTKNLYALDFKSKSDSNVVYRISNNIPISHPYGITAYSGNLYVCDTSNHRIQKIDSLGQVTTFAGSNQGFANGQGTTAKFNEPRGIVADSGNLYVADSGNHRIRKIDSLGQVTTIAGSEQGFADGEGAAARFYFPIGITMDSGILHVADALNHRIRKIVIDTGQVTTIAGSEQGFADGQGEAAKFNLPIGIVADSGILYVTDCDNHRIRKIDTSGNVTTIAGSEQGFADEQGTNAKFSVPIGIVADSGILYVTDSDNHRIRKIDTSGNVTTFAGSEPGFVDGQGATAQFYSPEGITIDSGNLYVIDSENNRIRKIVINTVNVTTLVTPSYKSEIFVGTPNLPASASSEVNGYRTSAQFQGIDRIELDSRGNLYLSETPYRRIRFIDPAGYVSTLIKDDFNVTSGTTSPGLIVPSILGISKTTPTLIRYQIPTGEIYDFSPENIGSGIDRREVIVSTIAGSIRGDWNGQGEDARFNAPIGILADSGNLYVCDTYNHRIRKIDSLGNVTTFAGNAPGWDDKQGEAAKFFYPRGITIHSGILYVADSENNRIRKIDSLGNVTTFAGSIAGSADGPSGVATFRNPYSILADSGNLYVIDSYNHRIRKIEIATGLVSTIAGSIQGDWNGEGTNARFAFPRGITIHSGNLYVTDFVNNRIRKIDSLGNVTTFAGSIAGSADGPSGVATFNRPTGIIADSENLYVIDSNNHRIRKIVIATGQVTTIAGSEQGSEDGPSGVAKFRWPEGITIHSGNLYVTDEGNNRIRKITFI